MNRREFFLGIGGVALSAGIAGCGGVVGPDPRVINAELDAGILDSFVGQAEVDVTVLNEGPAGEVVVYIEIFDRQDTLLNRFGEEIYMQEGERRRVTIRIDVADDADYYETHSDAT
jgi:hypothetical protein